MRISLECLSFGKSEFHNCQVRNTAGLGATIWNKAGKASPGRRSFFKLFKYTVIGDIHIEVIPKVRD